MASCVPEPIAAHHRSELQKRLRRPPLSLALELPPPAEAAAPTPLSVSSPSGVSRSGKEEGPSPASDSHPSPRLWPWHRSTKGSLGLPISPKSLSLPASPGSTTSAPHKGMPSPCQVPGEEEAARGAGEERVVGSGGLLRQDCLRRGVAREAREAVGLEGPGEAKGEVESKKPVTGAWRRLQRMVLSGGSDKERPRPSSASTPPGGGHGKARSQSLPPPRNKVRRGASLEDGQSASKCPWPIPEAAMEERKEALSLDSPGWSLSSPGWIDGSQPELWEEEECTVHTGPALTVPATEVAWETLGVPPGRRERGLLPLWSDSRWEQHRMAASSLLSPVVSFSDPLLLRTGPEEPSRATAEAMGHQSPTLHLVKWTARIVRADSAALRALGFESEAAAAQRSVLDIADGLTAHEWTAAVSKLVYGESTCHIMLRLLKSDRAGTLDGSWVLMKLSAQAHGTDIVATLSRAPSPPWHTRSLPSASLTSCLLSPRDKPLGTFSGSFSLSRPAARGEGQGAAEKGPRGGEPRHRESTGRLLQAPQGGLHHQPAGERVQQPVSREGGAGHHSLDPVSGRGVASSPKGGAAPREQLRRVYAKGQAHGRSRVMIARGTARAAPPPAALHDQPRGTHRPQGSGALAKPEARAPRVQRLQRYSSDTAASQAWGAPLASSLQRAGSINGCSTTSVQPSSVVLRPGAMGAPTASSPAPPGRNTGPSKSQNQRAHATGGSGSPAQGAPAYRAHCGEKLNRPQGVEEALPTRGLGARATAAGSALGHQHPAPEAHTLLWQTSRTPAGPGSSAPGATRSSLQDLTAGHPSGAAVAEQGAPGALLTPGPQHEEAPAAISVPEESGAEETDTESIPMAYPVAPARPASQRAPHRHSHSFEELRWDNAACPVQEAGSYSTGNSSAGAAEQSALPPVLGLLRGESTAGCPPSPMREGEREGSKGQRMLAAESVAGVLETGSVALLGERQPERRVTWADEFGAPLGRSRTVGTMRTRAVRRRCQDGAGARSPEGEDTPALPRRAYTVKHRHGVVVRGEALTRRNTGAPMTPRAAPAKPTDAPAGRKPPLNSPRSPGFRSSVSTLQQPARSTGGRGALRVYPRPSHQPVVRQEGPFGRGEWGSARRAQGSGQSAMW